MQKDMQVLGFINNEINQAQRKIDTLTKQINQYNLLTDMLLLKLSNELDRLQQFKRHKCQIQQKKSKKGA